jgi:hypothetical protein
MMPDKVRIGRSAASDSFRVRNSGCSTFFNALCQFYISLPFRAAFHLLPAVQAAAEEEKLESGQEPLAAGAQRSNSLDMSVELREAGS